jgi:hypothetical protein
MRIKRGVTRATSAQVSGHASQERFVHRRSEFGGSQCLVDAALRFPRGFMSFG